jgi:hypothetical protein
VTLILLKSKKVPRKFVDLFYKENFINFGTRKYDILATLHLSPILAMLHLSPFWLLHLSPILAMLHLSPFWLCYISHLFWLCYISHLFWLCYISHLFWLLHLSPILAMLHLSPNLAVTSLTYEGSPKRNRTFFNLCLYLQLNQTCLLQSTPLYC